MVTEYISKLSAKYNSTLKIIDTNIEITDKQYTIKFILIKLKPSI